MLGLLFALLQSAGSGASLPATCTIGDAFYLQTILPPSGWFNCTATNTWTQRPIAAADLTSGTVDPLRLGASPTAGKFLRGDSTWQTIAGGGDLLAANNLSDLVSATTARTNLGLAAMAQVASVTLTGDVTGSGTSSFPATIAANAVTNAKAAQMANSTFKCRNTAGTGNAEDCTVAQSKTLLGVSTYVVLTAARTNATTSYADITDLVIPVAANQRLAIACRFVYSANATTTGIGIGWTGPTSPTLTGGLMVTGLTTATVGGTTSVGNDTGAVTTSSVATTGNFATFEGTWNNGSNAGNVQMRFKSEVAIASAIVIQPGSWCRSQAF